MEPGHQLVEYIEEAVQGDLAVLLGGEHSADLVVALYGEIYGSNSVAIVPVDDLGPHRYGYSLVAFEFNDGKGPGEAGDGSTRANRCRRCAPTDVDMAWVRGRP